MVTSLIKAQKELRSAADNIRLNVHSPSGPYIMCFFDPRPNRGTAVALAVAGMLIDAASNVERHDITLTVGDTAADAGVIYVQAAPATFIRAAQILDAPHK